MKLIQYIKENHNGNMAQCARELSVSPTQVKRWLKVQSRIKGEIETIELVDNELPVKGKITITHSKDELESSLDRKVSIGEVYSFKEAKGEECDFYSATVISIKDDNVEFELIKTIYIGEMESKK
jgi:hypothetical protein